MVFPITYSFGDTAPKLISVAGCICIIISALRNLKDIKLYSINLTLAAIYTIYLYENLYKQNTGTFYGFFYASFVGFAFAFIPMITYKYLTEKEKNDLYHLFIGILVITAITSIFILIRYDAYAVRNLGISDRRLLYDISFYYRRNCATWGMTYAYAFSLPSLFNRFHQTERKIYLVSAIIISAFIIMAQITFAQIIMLAFWFFVFLKPKTTKKLFTYIMGFIVIAMILYMNITKILMIFYRFFEAKRMETTALRIYELYISFYSDRLYGDAAARMELYLASFWTFLKKPFVGTKSVVVREYSKFGLHSQILDSLAATGIIGSLCGFTPIFTAIRRNNRFIKDEMTRSYFIITICMFVFYLLINPSWFCPEILFTTFCLLLL